MDHVVSFHLLSWLGLVLASSLGPVLILRSFSIPFSEKQAVSMMILGLLASSNFRYFGYHSYFNETFIGILAGLLVFVITSVKNSSKLKKSLIVAFNNLNWLIFSLVIPFHK